MKLRYNIGIPAMALMVLSGCSSTRHVPEGEFLLRRTQVRINVPEDESRYKQTLARLKKSDPHPPRSDFVSLQRQVPNDRFFGYPLRLKMYSSANVEKDNIWSRSMQKAGQPPVIFNNMHAEQTVQRMQQHLVNRGHFDGHVHYVSDTLRRRASMRVVYYIHSGLGYHYRNIALDVRDDSLANLFTDWSSQTLIKSGEPYDVEVLDAERTRVVRQMRSLGFYLFDRDHIEFLIDSALNAHVMDITMIVNPPAPGQHSEKYAFADVRVFPEGSANPPAGKAFDTTVYRARLRNDTATQNFYFFHTEPLQIKPRVVASKLLTRSGEFYNLNNVDRTYENLLDLRVYNITNITIQPQPIDTNDPKNLLNATIEVRQGPRYSWSSDFEATNTTTGLQGASVHTSLQNRNMFGGAEIFSLRLRGLVELQYLLNKEQREESGSNLLNNLDIGLDATLDIPRFVAPSGLRRTSTHRPRTQISIGYSYQLRFQHYNRQLVNMALAYSWQQTRVSHTLSPLSISLVNISLDDNFAAELEKRAEYNRRLKYQYDNHFIFAARYNFAYSGQTARPVSFNAFRFSLESSGNLLYLLSNMLNASKNSDDQYQFFHLAYAQYLRTDADFRRYWYLSENHLVVTRLMTGGGFAYGNSPALPYEKGFFAGGSSNIRAWPMNMLGPGSFYSPDAARIERIGDMVLVGNIEYRFPITGLFKGALFVDAGNIWMRDNSESFPDGEFVLKNLPNDLAVGGGLGLRLDVGIFVVRLDAAKPLRDPAKPNGEKWVIGQTQWRSLARDVVLNFGIGYPF